MDATWQVEPIGNNSIALAQDDIVLRYGIWLRI